mmetsp:Transcript_6881/g.28200  ORF Transcript_6881/g.28200 Transcript_6881/m.28200 type:complete len:436 (+) Transcript_6881:117-1424(+)
MSRPALFLPPDDRLEECVRGRVRRDAQALFVFLQQTPTRLRVVVAAGGLVAFRVTKNADEHVVFGRARVRVHPRQPRSVPRLARGGQPVGLDQQLTRASLRVALGGHARGRARRHRTFPQFLRQARRAQTPFAERERFLFLGRRVSATLNGFLGFLLGYPLEPRVLLLLAAVRRVCRNRTEGVRRCRFGVEQRHVRGARDGNVAIKREEATRQTRARVRDCVCFVVAVIVGGVVGFRVTRGVTRVRSRRRRLGAFREIRDFPDAARRDDERRLFLDASQQRRVRRAAARVQRDADVEVLRHLGRLLGERDGALEVLLQRRVDGRGARGTHFAAALVSPPRLAHRLKRLRANARLGGAWNRRLAVHRRRAHDIPRAVGEPQRRQRLVVVHGRGGQRRDHHAPCVTSEAVPQQRRQNAVSIRHQLLGGAVCFLLLLG